MSRYGYIKHSELAHHGILGQKWGKRNGPPYPLDASDHSAQEKRLNGGKYTQGVKQDRSGKSNLSDEERAARKKKIKTALAIGAGATAAAGLTAAAIYAAKHPETAKAALSGAKDLAVAGAKSLKSNIKINRKAKSEAFKKNAKTLVKNSFNATKNKAIENLKSAKRADWKNSMTKKVAKKREKTGLMKEVSSKAAQNELIKNPWKIEANREKIERLPGGIDAVNELYRKAKLHEANTNYGANKKAEKKQTTGIKGVVNKVWKPVTATAGVIGAVGATANKVNNGINAVGQLANNPYAKKAYKAYMNSGYDYYDDYYNQQQPKKKKKS